MLCLYAAASHSWQDVIRPLVMLGSYGNDVARMHSIAALDLLVLNNPQAKHAHLALNPADSHAILLTIHASPLCLRALSDVVLGRAVADSPYIS